MKYFFTIILLISVIIQTFSKWIVIVECNINKEYIATNLCENRDKPHSSCHGKCFLQKKLADDEQKPNSKTVNSKNLGSELFIEKPQKIVIAEIDINQPLYYLYHEGKSQEFNKAIFQPPQYLG